MWKVLFPIILILCLASSAFASDCCPGLRSTEGEIHLGLDHIEIALADRSQAVSFWQEQLGFMLGEWQEHAGGLSRLRIPLRDGTAITLVHGDTALDRRSRHYAELCAAGGGPADIVLRGTDLEYIRFALEAVEEPLEFIDGRTKIELTRPRDTAHQPLRFVQYYLPDWDGRGATLHPNEARGISGLWLATDDLARDLLLLELLGGNETGELTTGAGPATIVSMDGLDILLHAGSDNGLLGLDIEVQDLLHCAAAMQLPGPGIESITGGPGSSFTLTPGQADGIWLQFTELTEQLDPGPDVPRDGGW